MHITVTWNDFVEAAIEQLNKKFPNHILDAEISAYVINSHGKRENPFTHGEPTEITITMKELSTDKSSSPTLPTIP